MNIDSTSPCANLRVTGCDKSATTTCALVAELSKLTPPLLRAI